MSFIYAVTAVCLVVAGTLVSCEAVVRRLWGLFFVALIIVALGAMGLIAMVHGML